MPRLSFHRSWVPVLLLGIVALVAPSARAGGLLRPGEQAPAVAFRSGTRLLTPAAWHGRRVLLWVFSTWCPSCRVGLPVLAREASKFRAERFAVVVLENHDDGGYAGPPLRKVVKDRAPSLLHAPGWTFGHATRAFDAVYNPLSYPDVFYLLRRNGTIARVSSAPANHLGAILRFARGGAGR